MKAALPHVAIFISSFAVTFSGAMMPGPLLTTTIAEGLRRGFVAGPLLITGHGLLELVLLSALLLGLSPLFHHLWFFLAVSFCGGAILLFMAWTMWRALPALEFAEAAGDTRQGRNLIIQGMAISLANPYFTIWWATIGIGYIMHSLRLGPSGLIAFFTGHLLADFFWYGIIATAAARGKRFLTPPLYRGIMAAGALFLAFFACYFIYLGLEKL